MDDELEDHIINYVIETSNGATKIIRDSVEISLSKLIQM